MMEDKDYEVEENVVKERYEVEEKVNVVRKKRAGKCKKK